MMSDADLAYAAAVAEIARVRAEGGDTLNLSGEEFHALTRLPEEIEDWIELKYLNLSRSQVNDIAPLRGLARLFGLSLFNTQISDLGPLAELTALQNLGISGINIFDISALAELKELEWLALIGTQVTDISSLSSLTKLKALSLGFTPLSDITVLAGMDSLRDLDLESSKVRDLRPICNLKLAPAPLLNALAGDGMGLTFDDTPAVNLDKKLAELAKIEDNVERTAKTLEYLRSLPPYPEPLPWQREMPAPPSDPALPMQITDQGISLASSRITVDETDDPIRDTLHRSLQEQVADLLRIAGNLDENAYRKACQLRDLLEVGLNAMNPLQVHLAIEALRRIKTGLGTNADRDLLEAIAGVLEIGPGLTLDTKEVQLHLDRSRRNLLEQRTQAEIEAEIRLAMSIGQTDLSGDDIKEIARFAATEAVDQFTAMRPTLTKNYVILAATFVLAQASGGIISSEALVLWQNAEVYRWLSANSADLRLLLQYWGEPFLVWLSPLLDQARFMVESGKLLIKKVK